MIKTNVVDGAGFSEGEYVRVKPGRIYKYLMGCGMGTVTYGFLKWVMETSTFVIKRKPATAYYEIVVLNNEAYRFWVRGRDLTRKGLPTIVQTW
jgi:hypothetical protein